MNITIYNAKPRKKTYEFGDRRVIRGVTHVRCMQYSHHYGAFVVSNGRNLVEWVPENEVDFNALGPRRKKD